MLEFNNVYKGFLGGLFILFSGNSHIILPGASSVSFLSPHVLDMNTIFLVSHTPMEDCRKPCEHEKSPTDPGSP